MRLLSMNGLTAFRLTTWWGIPVVSAAVLCSCGSPSVSTSAAVPVSSVETPEAVGHVETAQEQIPGRPVGPEADLLRIGDTVQTQSRAPVVAPNGDPKTGEAVSSATEPTEPPLGTDDEAGPEPIEPDLGMDPEESLDVAVEPWAESDVSLNVESVYQFAEGNGCTEGEALGDGRWLADIERTSATSIEINVRCLFTGDAIAIATAEFTKPNISVYFTLGDDFAVVDEVDVVHAVPVAPDVTVRWLGAEGTKINGIDATYAEFIADGPDTQYFETWVTITAGHVVEIEEVFIR